MDGRLNKGAIAHNVRDFRGQNRTLTTRAIADAFEHAWKCSCELTPEQITEARAFLETVLAEDDARIERGKEQILDDIAGGTVPGNMVDRFSHLHDYVDANYYGDLFETDLDGDELLNVGIIVQNALDAWMREGGHRPRLKDAE